MIYFNIDQWRILKMSKIPPEIAKFRTRGTEIKKVGDAYYIQVGGKKDFYGTLAYFNGGDSTINFEGKEPTISVKVNHSDGTSE